MAKVSIILPVFNVEDYIVKCLDSLINQSLQDIEIICINDGSTDNSLEIMKAYEQKDKRILVIDQENKGQGAARNKGLEVAQGEYIGFVDPDDWVDTDMYEQMYNQAKALNSEIVICDYIRYIEKNGRNWQQQYFRRATSVKSSEIFDVPSRKNLDKDIINPSLLISPCYCWNKIYKREFLQKNNMLFPNDRCYEDVMFILKSHILADNISYINKGYYYYRVNETSTLRTIENRYLCLLKVFEDVRNYLKEINLYDEFIDNLKYFILMNTVFIYENKKISKYDKDLIQKVKIYLEPSEYGKLKKILCPPLWEKIFSVTNFYDYGTKHKQIKLFGIRIKIKLTTK